jgi:predicted ArsR family transcriptional regulator
MAETRLVDPPTEVAVRGRRAEVLGQLREAVGPMSAVDVAAQTGLHVNTARFHLDGLVADGLAERAIEEREVPGRPRVLYAAHGTSPGPRSYGLLAEMLTGLVASSENGGPAAIEVGKAWGRHLIERAAPSERVEVAEATARLGRLFDAAGFQPEFRHDKQGGVEFRLHHCPFREVAERHQDVVCAIHLGLIQGALEEIRGPLEATELEPLVSPGLCIARLHATT